MLYTERFESNVVSILNRLMQIAELSLHYSLSEMIQFRKQKFPSQNLLISIPQAITYFEDVEESEDAVRLNGQSREKVKQQIQKQVRDFLA